MRSPLPGAVRESVGKGRTCTGHTVPDLLSYGLFEMVPKGSGIVFASAGKARGTARTCDEVGPKRVSWFCDRSVTAGGQLPLRPPNVAGMAPIPHSPEEPRDNPDSYVGLEAPSAERRALEHGWSTVRKLPPGAIITMEYRFGRLNLEVEDGRVKRAWKG
jgi:hypothetical protein